jgi:hypothetical protein
MGNTGLGSNSGERHRDDRGGYSVVQPAFYVERLPHAIRNPPIRPSILPGNATEASQERAPISRLSGREMVRRTSARPRRIQTNPDENASRCAAVPGCAGVSAFLLICCLPRISSSRTGVRTAPLSPYRVISERRLHS